MGGTTLPYTETYPIATISRQCSNDGETDYWNRIQNTEIKQHKYAQLIFWQIIRKQFNEGIEYIAAAKKMYIWVYINLNLTSYEKNFKWIMDLNVKYIAIKLLEKHSSGPRSKQRLRANTKSMIHKKKNW